ncbi:copper chaperone PCu(A)C [Cryobacterium sp. TMT1-2-1]|uniref:copper chaperone PCu(A)C n=1 Tax=Cryobacterium sp. TMT1-2-1 TaxID=1259232 RepID=UPI00106C704F|nr:copper chaperone PCu(A)C [Cryobacterium sp. TMT1-2-1]TFD41691.1 copper chaperone PCu(A)C [Cryobacterium sp. TMT1-2-1]
MKITTATRFAVVAAAVVLTLTSCAGTAAPAAPAAPATKQADSLAIEGAWMKAADGGMSAAFGVLENTGDEDVTIVSAATPASATVELHETVANDAGEMVMQETDGGYVVPAGDSFELAPGANHIMLMGLANPVKAGDEVTFTLTLSDGSTFEFDAPAKDFSGGNESYEGDTDMDN